MGEAPDSAARPQDQAAADPSGDAGGGSRQFDDELRRQIRGFAELLPELNYYEILGISRDASGDAIRQGFFERSKRFHPDRYFGKDVGVHGELLNEIYKRVAAAHDVLRDEKLRAKYDLSLEARADAEPPTGGEPPTGAEPPTESLRDRPRRKRSLANLERQIRSAEQVSTRLYCQAEGLRREGAWERAAETLRLALAHAPREQLYHDALAEVVPLANEARAEAALQRATALLEKQQRGPAVAALREAAELRPLDAGLSHRVASLLLEPDGDVEAARTFAERAAQLEDSNPRYRKTLALAFKAAGMREEARREFERVMLLDPKDREVKAELVLL